MRTNRKESKYRIQTDNLEKAAECIHWVITNIGPQCPGQVGTVCRGEGWIFWTRLVDGYNWQITVELTDDVDTETATIFMLKWA